MTNSPDRKIPFWQTALWVLSAPLILALVGIVILLRLVTSVCLHVAFWLWWNSRGRDILFVYSSSPVWQDHLETEILPLVRSRAVVLNWSERKRWRFGLAAAAFHHFGGSREFNPLVVVFRPFRRARVFRFWRPFRHWKHGRVEPLQRMEAEFLALLGVTKGDRAA